MQWYLKVLKNYAVFSGRARRREYWMFILFNIVVVFVLAFAEGLAAAFNGSRAPDQSLLVSFYTFAVIVPSVAVGVRRMHDTNRSGWWIVFPLVNFLLAVSEGQKGENRFGPDPKAAPATELVPPTVPMAHAAVIEERPRSEGATLSAFCSQCGAKFPEVAAYCSKCGAPRTVSQRRI